MAKIPEGGSEGAMQQMITKIDPMAFVVADRIQSVLGKGCTLERIRSAWIFPCTGLDFCAGLW